jgi:hypothetical protein
MRTTGKILAAVLLVAMLFAGLLIGFLISGGDSEPANPKTVTVEKTVPGPEKTVPGPERTVEKTVKVPGGTTWIIVCGEKTTKLEGSKPVEECKLPDTGGPPR